MTPSLCLLPVDVSVFVLVGTVQTVSTAHLNFCQRVVNRHTIIDSHCAFSSSEPLDTLFVPIRIIMLGILPEFISSTIQNSWAIVAPPKAITVVIQKVLRFWSTLTKLSPSIGCDVHWRLLQVYCWAPSRSIEAGARIRVRNSTEVILHLVVLLHVNHSGHFLHRHLSYLPVWDLRALYCLRCVTSSRSRHRLLGELYSAVSSIIPPGTFLLATNRSAVSIKFLTVCSTTGSPRVSLGSGIVILPVVVGGRTSVV